MLEDRALQLFETTLDEDRPAGSGPARRSYHAEPCLHLTISGVSGESVALTVPCSELEGRDLDAETLLNLAIDHGHDDFDGTPEELARRRTFLQSLPDQIAAAEGGPGSRYVLMMDDPEVGHRAVHPRAPVPLAQMPNHDLRVEFTIAPYHVGGS